MQPISRERLAASLAEARAQRNENTDALSQFTFLRQQDNASSWAIGPFEQDDSLSFTPRAEHDDPWGIGWTVGSVINPTTIVHDGVLHLFYRAMPRKESLSSRIGHARLIDGQWHDDEAMAVVPTLDNEVLGVEDPKIYRVDGRFVMFYNGIFEVSEEDRERYPSPGYPVEGIGCDINVAVSDDLITWTKRGAITNHALTRMWAKGAVIPRDGDGNAVRIGGQYLMYLSEGCDGVAHVAYSDDLLTWDFRPQAYLDLSGWDAHLHEVATAIVVDDELVLDFFVTRAGEWAAGQARYDIAAPFTQREISPGGTLAWGGVTSWNGELTFMQGWDAPGGTAQLQFFRAKA